MTRRVVIALNTAWNLVNFRAGLIRALVSAGYEVVAVAPPDEYTARLAELGCRYVPLPMDNRGTHPGRDLMLLGRFYRLLRRERPLVYLGYTIKPNVYGSLAAHALGIAVVNNISGLGATFIKNSWLTRVVRGLYRLALGRSARVFFQNEDDRRLFVESGLVREVVTGRVPGSGVDLARFALTPTLSQGERGPTCTSPACGGGGEGEALNQSPPQPSPQLGRGEMRGAAGDGGDTLTSSPSPGLRLPHPNPLPEGEGANVIPKPTQRRGGIRFLLIARMLWDKGVGEYVAAARKVRRRHPDAEFCLLGFLDVQNPAAISRAQMDEWVAEGVVNYLGVSDDVREQIAEADCVVLPSYREGTPRTLLEAAAMGRPVIAADAVGCREVVDDGVNGFLCRVRDADDLAATMEKMIGLSVEERVEMGRRGRKKVEREFDERLVIGAYLRVIREIEIARNK
jgi:glycosyltransferase involved in cell wall biosynthesis